MKKYSDHSNAEKLALTQEEFEKAVKLEAIERGIKLPITLDNIVKEHGFLGYNTPADAVFFYEVIVPNEYGHDSRTGIAYRTPEEARAALQGSIAIATEGYGADRRDKIVTGQFNVREVPIFLTPSKWLGTQLETLKEETKEYDDLLEECVQDISDLRQADYDREVIARKRAQYIELAGGNVEIAKRFWSQTERTEFPAENAQPEATSPEPVLAATTPVVSNEVEF